MRLELILDARKNVVRCVPKAKGILVTGICNSSRLFIRPEACSLSRIVSERKIDVLRDVFTHRTRVEIAHGLQLSVTRYSRGPVPSINPTLCGLLGLVLVF